MDTEYKGPGYVSVLHEIRQRGLRNSVWRAGYELRKRLGWVESHFRTDPLGIDELCGLFGARPSSAAELRRLLRATVAKTFIINPDVREEYVRAVRLHCPNALESLVAAADEICRGRFEFMGHVFDFAGGPIDWHFAPDTGRCWPRVRWNRLNLYGADAAGDVKLTWELNRHQFWPTLARAWWLTGDDTYAQAWVDQITGWLNDNPPEIGVNWLSNLEHAIRMANWWLALAMFLDSPLMSDDLAARILGVMVLKARHILADLDYSRINMANNHLLGDAMGLAVMGLTLPDMAESARWREIGVGTLWNEARRQINPDGTSFECAISYHRFVAYFYVLVVCLCRKAGIGVPDLVGKRLEGMFDFVLNLRRPDGGMPSIGDWDDGRTVVLSEHSLDDFRPMLSTGAVLFRRADLAWAAERLDEETLWLLGPRAADVFTSLQPAPPRQTSLAFAQGGYFISRSDWSDQAFHAAIKNGPFESHTHADLLNVELSAFGRPLLVDPGTYTYNGPWAWRTYFRSTKAHNTVMVDGEGQALAHRVFRWLFPPTGRTLAWHTSPSSPIDYYEGDHNGFRRLSGRPVHRRALWAVRGEYWLVLDTLLGKGRHDLELRLHFDPSLDVVEQDGQFVATGRGGVGARVIACSPTSLNTRIVRGQEDPIEGWHSPGYGRKMPSATGCLAASVHLPAWIAWLVLPYRETPSHVSLRRVKGKETDSAGPTSTAVHLEVELNEVVDTFFYRAVSRPVPVTPAPDEEGSAGAAWVRRDRRNLEVITKWSRG